MAEADRFLRAWQVAFYLGYRSTEARPTYGKNPQTPEERTDAKDRHAFDQARHMGRVPEPDMIRGKAPLWRMSTIRDHIAHGGGATKPTGGKKRGRPAKARVGGDPAPESEPARAA